VNLKRLERILINSIGVEENKIHENTRSIGTSKKHHGESHLNGISFNVKTRTSKEMKKKMD